MARLEGRVAIGAVLAAALIAGFLTQTESLLDELWSGLLTVIAPLVLLLTASLTVSLGEKVSLPAAVVSGVRMGCLSGIAFALGIFSPFALEVGGRELDEFGGDLAGHVVLFWLLITFGGGGAALGGVCGAAAWALWISLGHKPAERDRETRRAIR